jgi:hypothetical protein
MSPNLCLRLSIDEDVFPINRADALLAFVPDYKLVRKARIRVFLFRSNDRMAIPQLARHRSGGRRQLITGIIVV